VFLEKLTVPQLVKHSHVMETDYHYCIQNNGQRVHIMSQINPIPTVFLDDIFNIIPFKT
jgi:hypothetical protein